MAVQISRAPLDVSQVGSPSRGPIFKGATRTPLVQREICCVWSLDALPHRAKRRPHRKFRKSRSPAR
jgi:hypothetical protein